MLLYLIHGDITDFFVLKKTIFVFKKSVISVYKLVHTLLSQQLLRAVAVAIKYLLRQTASAHIL